MALERLRNLCSSIAYGLTASATDVATPTKFLRITDIVSGSGSIGWASVPYVDASVSERQRYSLRSGDIVIARTGATTGRSAYVIDPPNAVFASYLVRFRILPEYNARFVAYAIRGPRWWTYVRGVLGDKSAQPNASARTLSDAWIDVPDRATQDSVAELLGAIDDKIDLNRKTTETLEELARTLFASQFGLLNYDLAPHGWTVAALSDHVDVTRGLSYNGAGLSDDGIPLYNLDSIYEGGGYKYHGLKHYRGEFKDRHVVRGGDLLVANTEQGFEHLLIGFPALVPEQFTDLGLYSHHLYRVRPKTDSHLTGRFLYFALMSQRLRQVVVGYSNGTTVNMLPADSLQRPRLAVPPSDLVTHFDVTVSPFFAKQEQLQLESETLTQFRDLLLPKLMSGEIRLKEAEKAVAEAL